MTHPLDKDIQAYTEKLEELKQHHNGKYMLFRNGELIDAFDSFDNAAQHAVKKYGRGPYLIRKVGRINEIPLPASVAYRASYADS